ncbi:MAG TPA: Asd/ArgC dimerization domain-containing protein [Acidobacteriaceae bacterium]|nr:Asd/ArgC dimerization domain-containing protein [Acidobacteriaceae bacterium]
MERERLRRNDVAAPWVGMMNGASTNRIAIVGASSLAGKELSEVLAESPLAAGQVVLLDAEGGAGQIVASGEDISVVHKVDEASFDGMDFVFFAGNGDDAVRYWKAARQAGASIVDMTGALTAEPGVIVRAPWLLASDMPTSTAESSIEYLPDLSTPAIVSANPAAMILAATARRIGARVPVLLLGATVLVPASEHGRGAMDELHQQTVSLLSFQGLPREHFDEQAAFNLLPALGESAKVSLDAIQSRISGEYLALAGPAAPELAIQVAQVPVFHSYALSVLIELSDEVNLLHVEAALRGGQIDVPGAGAETPTNIAASGQAQVLVRVNRAATDAAQPANRFWLWMTADNLKLAALNAIACAGELRRLRPLGKVQ